MTNTKALYKVKKWAIVVMTAVLFAVLQGTFSFMNIKGVKPLFLLPFCVCFSMFNKEIDSCILGVVCGMLLDVISGRLFGFSSICFMAFCIMSSLLISYLIKTNLVNSMLLTGTSLIVYYLLDFLFRYLIWGEGDVFEVFIVHIIPTIVYTVLITPLIYWLCKFYHCRLDGVNVK